MSLVGGAGYDADSQQSKREEGGSLSVARVKGRVLRVGVIGAGFIGGLHARILSECPSAELVAVADADGELARKVASAYGAAAYEDYNELLRREDIQAVSVCVPEEVHEPVGVAVARAGKHMLLEKPIAKTVAEAEAISRACEQAGVRMMVAHVLRFDPRYVQLHDAILRGEIGDPIHIRVKRNNPWLSGARLKGRVSILHYLGVHDIDLMRWYAGSDVVKVYGAQVSKRLADIGAADSLFALLTFANGALGLLDLSWALPKEVPSGIVSHAEVMGTKGIGYVEIFEQGLRLFTEGSGVVFPDTLHWPEVNGRVSGDLAAEIEHFVTAVLEGREFLMSTADAIKAVEVIEAIQESIRSGQAVALGR